MPVKARKPKASFEPPVVDLKDHPEYRAKHEKKRELIAERSAVKERIREVEAALATAPAAARQPTNAIDQAAVALLEGGSEEEEAARLQEELRGLRQKEQVLGRAIEFQDLELRKTKGAASREIVDRIRPDYVALLERMAAAVAELGSLAEQENAFRRALISAGVDFTGRMPAMSLREFLLRDSQSRGSRWLKDVRDRYGITPDQS